MPEITRQKHGKFAKGHSANPRGRPRGSRNRATMEIEALLDADANKLGRVAIKKALGGDMAALKLCLDRIAPPTRERTVIVELPELNEAQDIAIASAGIIRAVSRGEIGVATGETLLRLLDSHRRVIESADLEKRIVALEGALVQGR